MRITPSVQAALRDAIARKDFNAYRILSTAPTIPVSACICNPFERVEPPIRSRRWRPRPLQTPRTANDLNACNTAWPGGLQYIPPNAELPAGWVRTRIEGGFPTNPRCYPPSAQALLDAENDGTFTNGRRNALLAHQRPDVTAATLDQLAAAIRSGNLAYPAGLRRISELLNPPLSPAQLARFQAAETAEERRLRLELQKKGLLPAGALSLEEAQSHCRRNQTGNWFCYTQWPGGWLPEGAPALLGNPAWLGPTPYGVLLPGCFGFTRDRLDRLGQSIIDAITRRTTTAVTPPSTTTPPVTPKPPQPPLPPPPPTRPPPGTPYIRAVQINIYGIEYGEIRFGYITEPHIASIQGVYPWTLQVITPPA